MVSNSAKLDCRTKHHTQSGVSMSDSSRDMARTKVAGKKKKKKKMNIDNPIKYPLRGSLMMMMMIIIPCCTVTLDLYVFCYVTYNSLAANRK